MWYYLSSASTEYIFSLNGIYFISLFILLILRSSKHLKTFFFFLSVVTDILPHIRPPSDGIETRLEDKLG